MEAIIAWVIIIVGTFIISGLLFALWIYLLVRFIMWIVKRHK